MLLAYPRPRQTLLVLDTMEQVIDAAPSSPAPSPPASASRSSSPAGCRRA
ncbi:MAG: hypothetical protein AVDCRST_MAG49-2729 [uncultured Thermomicrobiales bacterium]|uniref:Uncharacterized protein n=1 Tax=uncultured Thermomicrobiales bacterium TaxID=1645740 RepID=A0A6J4V107_9BACT|nr:MAG: hypothetical protein AVDCRST_MAG49-2729 [uncultured Thermomicrobiales bacterium]